jgi:hypothetical protein
LPAPACLARCLKPGHPESNLNPYPKTQGESNG